MSAKPIKEFDGKHLLSYWLPKSPSPHSQVAPDSASLAFLTPAQMASITFDMQLIADPKAFKSHLESSLDAIVKRHPWLLTTQLVVKPDQLIKRRGKNGLLGINLNWAGVKAWIMERAGVSFKVLTSKNALMT